MEQTVDINYLKVAKVKCLRSLLFHTRYFFKAQYSRKFIIGRHHEIICDALERVLSGDCKRLIINIAPRYGKTELAVKSFISHGLALNPSAKFIHLSYSDSLALDNSEAVKDLISSDAYQQLFPSVKIKKDSKAKDKWYTTAGGGVLARSASGSVTGFGAGKVDDPDEEIDEFILAKEGFNGAVIIDDPLKPDDADSDTVRGRVNDRFDSTIRNRVNSRNTPIIIIMQRLHPLDLAGYLQRDDEQDKWEVISLPCLYFDEYGVKQSLWPFKETIEELELQKAANDVVFERQKQQNPKPKTGLMFPEQDLHYFDYKAEEKNLKDPDMIYLAADPAGDGGDDFAAVVARLVGDKIYITDVLYNTDGTDHNEKAVVEMVLENKVHHAGIEGVLGWAETVNRIRKELEEKNSDCEVRLLRPRTGKHQRIYNRSAFVRNNFYFRKDYKDYPQYFKYMRNITSYLNIQEPGKTNKHDEGPDVNEMVASYFEKNFPQLW
jgi:hypothetical protein